jgi:hypothetical protein
MGWRFSSWFLLDRWSSCCLSQVFLQSSSASSYSLCLRVNFWARYWCWGLSCLHTISGWTLPVTHVARQLDNSNYREIESDRLARCCTLSFLPAYSATINSNVSHLCSLLLLRWVDVFHRL